MSIENGRKRFAFFAWGVLAYNILVILWGAYVRASFSGDGCGDHWPLCNGNVIPYAPATKTIVEFLHRAMTGLDTPAVILLAIWAFRAFPRKHAVRMWSLLSLGFLFLEALLGAGLVLFKYVAKDASVGRVIYLSAHLTNTMLLLSALTITAWLAFNQMDRLHWSSLPPLLKGALPVTLIVCVTGGITALGDMLFPATSLAAGMHQDFSASSSLLLRLRLIHPIVAVLCAAYLLSLVVTILVKNQDGILRASAIRVMGIMLFQLAVGALNITLLAPVWIQILHLFMADLLWIAVLLLVLGNTSVRKPTPALVYA